MLYMPMEDLFKKVDSIFKLTVLAARRAQQLNDGAAKLVESDASKISTVALEEIMQGKIKL
ncbi:MAG: DNA-directed RNA polymerase subunit omega [Candidatus Ratteibacteria bacterium]|nr:DNA-directed RNA polymerase subunit omega [Candidatus Ratteibacteria bacterium]